MRWSLVTSVFLVLLPLAAWANDGLERLMTALHVPALVQVMADEGKMLATSIDENYLDGQGGSVWATQVEQIHAAERLMPPIRDGIGAGLDADEIALILTFFESDLGQRIAQTEVEARRLLLDPTIEGHARRTAVDHPLAERVTAFMEINDLVALNVAGTMASNLRFVEGLTRNGSEHGDMADLLNDGWGDEDGIREDVETWLRAYLTLTFSGLSEADIDAYLAFCETAPGQRLNAALFDGFGAAYAQVSYAIGQAAALHVGQSDI